MASTYEDFLAIEIRVGTIREALPFPEARMPAYKLLIDFGPLGTRTSSAQITENYCVGDLVGRQVAAVTSFPPKRIAGFTSEVLVLGAVREGAGVVLLQPDSAVPPGTRIL